MTATSETSPVIPGSQPVAPERPDVDLDETVGASDPSVDADAFWSPLIEKWRNKDPEVAAILERASAEEDAEHAWASKSPMARKLLREPEVVAFFEDQPRVVDAPGYCWRQRSCDLLDLVERLLPALDPSRRRPHPRRVQRVATALITQYLADYGDGEDGSLDELRAGVSPPLPIRRQARPPRSRPELLRQRVCSPRHLRGRPERRRESRRSKPLASRRRRSLCSRDRPPSSPEGDDPPPIARSEPPRPWRFGRRLRGFRPHRCSGSSGRLGVVREGAR
jgi:hypothetical protein